MPCFRPKWSKLIPYFKPKRLKKNSFGAAHTYTAYIRDYPPGAKNAVQIMSLAAYASETIKPTYSRFSCCFVYLWTEELLQYELTIRCCSIWSESILFWVENVMDFYIFIQPGL